MKIAVVGAGISGLVCAHHLSARADVHVFDALAHTGGHTNTVDVKTPSGDYPVDTGFIVFNDRTYPRFIKLMEKLGVAAQPSTMSFSVKSEISGLEYNGTTLNSLFAQRSNLFKPSFYRMVKDILRFNAEAPRLLETDSTDEQTLGDYLARGKYSREFIDHYIVPMGAAIWSAGARQMRDFPVAYFVRFFKNHGMLSVDNRPQWRVIKGGSKTYIPALIAPFKDRLRLNAPVKSVKRTDSGVLVDGAPFDHVVLAGHADQMLPLLSDATPKEREILGSFSYQENPTVLHTDTSVMPRRRLAWAAWNYLIPAEPQEKVAVTYDMNILQSLEAPETFLVSLNMKHKIDPSKVIKTILYHHPVYTARAVAAQKRWEEISHVRNTHFCGAYWGFGFHEDGVASGERVCGSLGVRIA